MRGEESGRRKTLASGLAAAFLLVIATRWPLLPKHLFHIDNINFALALDDFDPSLDQPQPPGYPLYVALARILRPVFPRPEVLFPVIGILGSALALVILWRLVSRMLGWRAGIAAAVLLAFNPVFWLAGVGNYVRVYLALGAVVVARLAWESWSTKDVRYAYFAAVALGVSAGFRPELGVLLLPLVLVSLRSWRLRPLLVSVACAALAALPWLVVTAARSGGVLRYWTVNRQYLAYQSGPVSLFYGASLGPAVRMAAAATYWTLLGAAAWIWVLLLPRDGEAASSMPRKFVAWWYLPPFAFYALVHIHNPDQALTIIPVVCVAGGAVLARITPRQFVPALATAAAFNVLLFFYPTGSPFWASNYRIAQYTMRTTEAVYAGVSQLLARGPATVIWRDAFVTPQEIGYYFPDVPVIAFHDANAPIVRLHNHDTRFDPATPASLPAGLVMWEEPISPHDAHFFDSLGAASTWGALRYVEVKRGQRFSLGGWPFVAGEASR